MGVLVEVQLLQDRAGQEPALEVALSAALLDEVAGGRRGPLLRCYRPPATVAFGRRDAFRPGFRAAVEAAREHGFAAVVRAPGGQAAAYDEGCLIVEEIVPAGDALSGIHERFAHEAERQAQALRRLGVDARVGAVPGEYCPGAFSVNARGRKKLIGAAQRVVRGGWLLSSVVVIESAARIRPVLEGVHSALELGWDPDTVGSVAEEAPGLDVDGTRAALLAQYAERYVLIPAAIAEAAITSVLERIALHRATA